MSKKESDLADTRKAGSAASGAIPTWTLPKRIEAPIFRRPLADYEIVGGVSCGQMYSARQRRAEHVGVATACFLSCRIALAFYRCICEDSGPQLHASAMHS